MDECRYRMHCCVSKQQSLYRLVLFLFINFHLSNMIQYFPKTINITFNYSYYVTLFFAVAVGFVSSVSFKGDVVSLTRSS